jgi:hypothetical protein
MKRPTGWQKKRLAYNKQITRHLRKMNRTHVYSVNAGLFIYACNKPKSVLARDLGDCRDNLRNSERVSHSYFFRLLRYLLVSDTTTPFNAISAIRLGIAIRPLNISAIVHTAETVIKGPMKIHKIYNHL